MSDISIRRNHGKTRAQARKSAEHMAAELKEEFDLDYDWDGDVMNFKRPGVSGELSLDSKEVALEITLGLLLFALKPSIEREVQRFFDENFPA
ncbi:polyhydroxyalkanoic acid synthase [Candidatus Accumulibacter phosphatis]|jgi:putative polyhydroxyalkanoate system protein|uniref:Polyhydroxyalkanoic acid synthase n=1 Tax=Candidatus Accumulibacter phosphatis TaxID=327160 RepID=A0ABX1U4B5_9PROT|nr:MULTISPECIES: polyhydroxyalkanoic acid system family protein [Candidatus Accumulibacter]NMQ29703.1 polyhydroxyalkanoic acid synthase [Candidatus Accumulibacter phosphatis]